MALLIFGVGLAPFLLVLWVSSLAKHVYYWLPSSNDSLVDLLNDDSWSWDGPMSPQEAVYVDSVCYLVMIIFFLDCSLLILDLHFGFSMIPHYHVTMMTHHKYYSSCLPKNEVEAMELGFDPKDFPQRCLCYYLN